ncbi:MAG: succinoglycan biosynthesis protein [Hyphomicrobium sp.]|jgi:endonuclease YncB( thermonuclease family)|nr:succinoglycan biosynthesis protein [Hyphomicrobium sp.]PPD06464.1 MAG: succinoglycan biosynthesis protein [Hyphomicrobium sp.]
MSESEVRPNFRRSVAFALAGVLLTTTTSGSAVALNWLWRSDVSGTATVVDGDTLEIAGEKIRLEGIDAPESAQTCGRAKGGTWACGREAADVLAKLVARRRVSCQNKGFDKYERMLGVCSVDGKEINAEMIRRGLAWAFVKYSTTYVNLEKEARGARAGIWQGEAEAPWIYRENRWKVAEQQAPDGCAIKGNITENGHIYHMPWSPWYGRVKVDPSQGERWFCSEAEAKSAGWRSAGLR